MIINNDKQFDSAKKLNENHYQNHNENDRYNLKQSYDNNNEMTDTGHLDER